MSALVALLALLGAPLFVILAGAALLLFHAEGLASSGITIEMYRMARAPALSAIPLFTFAGYVLAASQAPGRAVAVARALLGWMPGGVAVTALATSAFFTAFTGASGVTIVALGGFLLPVLVAERYPERFAYGLLTTGGSLGLLFAPSLPLILYGLVAEVDVGRLFLAGAVPGALLVVVLSAYSAYTATAASVARSPFSFSALARAVRGAGWEIPLPIVVLAGIYGGVVTPTEAAAVTAAYAVFVTAVVRRELSVRRDLVRIAAESMLLVGAILLILGAAMGLTGYLVDAEVPTRLLEAMRERIRSPVAFLILLNLFLLAVGSVMDIFSAIVVTAPLVVPIARQFGVDPLHLGIVFLTNLEIGYSHPPLGLNLFLASYRFQRPILRLTLDSLPFIVLLLLCLGVITYIPSLSTWLPAFAGGP